MTVICAGYYDFEDVLHPCGVIIEKVLTEAEFISHGLCVACSVQAMDVLEKMREAKASVDET